MSRKRIGQGKSKLSRGHDNRISLYGIYDNDICIYEGYECDGVDGNRWTVGLPLAGVNAAHLQPPIPLSEIKVHITIAYFKT
jgi:hypothetical protein